MHNLSAGCFTLHDVKGQLSLRCHSEPELIFPPHKTFNGYGCL